jgi:hypothetical protein
MPVTIDNIIQWLRMKNLSEWSYILVKHMKGAGQSPYAVDGHLGPSSSVITAHSCTLQS